MANLATGTPGRGAVELVITPTEADLGQFSVRRALPSVPRQRIGPFIFFDHFGPTHLEPGAGVDVRPHPHIGLATVTYLFEGELLHRDSLGYEQLIRPGAVNWMTAGRGIVHSERTPANLQATGSPLHGIQIWVALPEELEDTDPGFVHYPASEIPEFQYGSARIGLIAGSAFGHVSPVQTASPTFYAAVTLPAGETIATPEDVAECGIYVASGAIAVEDNQVESGRLALLRPGAVASVKASETSELIMFGGAPLTGERHIVWNFVSSSRARIEQAKSDWRNQKFDPVPGDDTFIPLPD